MNFNSWFRSLYPVASPPRFAVRRLATVGLAVPQFSGRRSLADLVDRRRDRDELPRNPVSLRLLERGSPIGDQLRDIRHHDLEPLRCPKRRIADQ
jgi:hypothetical protein